ncbi:hypothetical protein [Winogradskyella sp.]
MPAKLVEVFKLETLLLILACYAGLIIGFGIVNFKTKSNNYKNVNKGRLIKSLLLSLLVCFLLRWIDLFYYRNLSFFNDFLENRRLNEMASTTNIAFIFASIFKSIYFFPFVILLKCGHKSKLLSITAILFLFFPLVEALLLGTRKPYFEIAFIIIISLFIFRKIRFNLVNLVGLFIAGFLLMTVSYKVLIKREIERGTHEDVYKVITNGRYNDLLKPNEKIVEYINDPTVDSNKKNYALILLQTGQYINHGVFEFNHIIDSNIPIGWGRYTMYPFFKFYDKLVAKNNYENFNPSPRKYVYLTAFGSFYIDFRWASVVIFLLFGMVQKYFYTNFKDSIIHSPLVVYLAIINVFLPIFNYLRGSGIYPFIGFSLFFVICHFFLKKLNEKSIST